MNNNNSTKSLVLIAAYNALVPQYVTALRQSYATIATSRSDPASHAEAHEQRMAVQNQMHTLIAHVSSPCYMDPDTLCLVEGTIPDREGFVSCLMSEENTNVYIYLNADDYDYPIGLEMKIIGEECR